MFLQSLIIFLGKNKGYINKTLTQKKKKKKRHFSAA